MSNADLINARLRADPPGTPALMVGEILDVADDGRLTVTVPAIDGGRRGLRAFGRWPDAAAKDPVRVHLDQYGGVVVVAWEPADA
jgi:hypothetical protein